LNAAEPKLKLFAFGVDAKGIIAIGAGARGVLAVGINAMGIFAVGVNAMGTIGAAGINAIGLFALSPVNCVGFFSLAGVNIISAFGRALVNEMTHPLLGVVFAVVAVIVARQISGAWQPQPTLATCGLVELLSGARPGGTVRAAVLSVEHGSMVVGDSDGQHTLQADRALLDQAAVLLQSGHPRAYFLVEVEREASGGLQADYRLAATPVAILHARELRPAPRRWRGPQSLAELNWLIRQSLYLSAAAGLVTCIVALIW